MRNPTEVDRKRVTVHGSNKPEGNVSRTKFLFSIDQNVRYALKSWMNQLDQRSGPVKIVT
jgi:hypothetical protein